MIKPTDAELARFLSISKPNFSQQFKNRKKELYLELKAGFRLHCKIENGEIVKPDIEIDDKKVYLKRLIVIFKDIR